MLRIYAVLLDLIRRLRGAIKELERQDPDLARQCRRALASAPLNLAEGTQSLGRNRLARYHNALGSLQEAQACLEVAVAFGYLAEIDPGILDHFDHVLRTLARLCQPRS